MYAAKCFIICILQYDFIFDGDANIVSEDKYFILLNNVEHGICFNHILDFLCSSFFLLCSNGHPIPANTPDYHGYKINV